MSALEVKVSNKWVTDIRPRHKVSCRVGHRFNNRILKNNVRKVQIKSILDHCWGDCCQCAIPKDCEVFLPSTRAPPIVARRMRMNSSTDGMRSWERLWDCVTWELLHASNALMNLNGVTHQKCSFQVRYCSLAGGRRQWLMSRGIGLIG